MWLVTIRGLLAHKLRLLLTSVAVVLGVSFMAGTLVLTDTLGNVFDTLFTETTKGIDTVVRSKQSFDVSNQQSGGDETNQRNPVPASLLDPVRAVDGIAAAEGSVQGYALVVGKDGERIQGQAPTIGISWSPDRRFNQALNLVRGRGPRAPDEIALDTSTADDGDYRVGDQVPVVFLDSPPATFTLVGVFRFGDTGNAAGATLAAFELETAQRLMNRVDQFDLIEAAAEPGISEEQLRDRITSGLRSTAGGSRYEAITGADYAAEQADSIKDNIGFVSTFLLVFAGVALFVGAFIIYNTFSIIIAQRARELALLRALGASGGQVTSSVATEALAVGLLSSFVGLGLGVLVAIGLKGLFGLLGADLPSGGLEVAPRTIVVALVVGTVVTFVSALAPARRAARIPPIAALRDAQIESASSGRRFAVGAALTVLGLVLLGLGLFADPGGFPGGAAGLVGFAAFLVFVGVAMLSPLFARPAARVLGWPTARFRGMSGRLARENAMRNPRRTATTASALMIGLALVSLVSILGQSAKQSFSEIIDQTVGSDVLLTGANFTPFSPEVVSRIQDELPDAEVVEFRPGFFQLGGSTKALLGTSPNIAEGVDLALEPGAQLDEFADDGILVHKDVAEDRGWKVGDEIRMRFERTGVQRITIRGIFGENRAVGSDYLLSLASYEEHYVNQLDVFVGVGRPPGLSGAATKAAVVEALRDFPNVEVRSQGEYKDEISRQFDQFLALVYVLLLLAVLIALIGIVNTLALSIFERTRELGLLRAVGMTRRQMKRMIRDEAVIIAVFGALLGLVIGVGFGAALVGALSDEGISFSFPGGQLVIFVILAGVAGLVAGAWPARRAARMNVLEAVNTD